MGPSEQISSNSEKFTSSSDILLNASKIVRNPPLSPIPKAPAITSHSYPRHMNIYVFLFFMMLTKKQKKYSISHLFISMIIQELITLNLICELGRTQLLTILARSVQKP